MWTLCSIQWHFAHCARALATHIVRRTKGANNRKLMFSGKYIGWAQHNKHVIFSLFVGDTCMHGMRHRSQIEINPERKDRRRHDKNSAHPKTAHIFWSENSQNGASVLEFWMVRSAVECAVDKIRECPTQHSFWFRDFIQLDTKRWLVLSSAFRWNFTDAAECVQFIWSSIACRILCAMHTVRNANDVWNCC